MNAGSPASGGAAGAGSSSATTSPSGQTVGTGDISNPAIGPEPTEAAKVGGAPFTLVKNWDFGSDGTIKNMNDLIAEFQFHDEFNTIANGSNYGAVIVAPNAATAIPASGLGLPNNMQPVEDPARPTREFTNDVMRAYVRPLSPNATTVSVSAHDTGNGSLMAKWTLPKGGALLKQDLLWETRARITTPQSGYWFAIWTAGDKWNRGAEMDTLESYGTPNIGPGANAFHVNSVGGSDKLSYSSWPQSLTSAGIPMSDRNLQDWHIWTWVYHADDTYEVYYDDYLAQSGTIHWTLSGSQGGEQLNMDFLFDFGWGHTQIPDVNISLPASAFPITYEVDYSRVYLR